MKLTWKEHPDLSGPTPRRGGLGRCEGRALFLPLSAPAAGSGLAPRDGSDGRWSRAKGSRSTQEAWDCRNRARAALSLQPMLLMLKNSHSKRHLSWLDLLTCYAWDAWMADWCQHRIFLILQFRAEFWSSLIHGMAEQNWYSCYDSLIIFLFVLCDLM